MTDVIPVCPHACGGRGNVAVPMVSLPVLSRTVAVIVFAASDWLKQPTFVRLVELTLMPGANEGEFEPANSSAGTDVLKLPAVTSLLTTKRLLGSGRDTTTTPPPVVANTVPRKFPKTFCSPAARVMVASFFVPVASKKLAVME